MTRPICCALLLVLVLCWSPPAVAQITIDADDARAVFDERYYVQQTAYPRLDDLNGLQALVDQVSDAPDDQAQTYDFSAFAFNSVAFQLQFEFVPRDEAGGLPGADNPAFDEADYVEVATGSSEGITFTIYNYASIEEGSNGGFIDYGNVVAGMTFVNDPPLREIALPLTLGTTWTSSTNGGSESVEGEVVGYGTLVLPNGDAEAVLVARRTITEEFAGETETSRYIDFFTAGLLRQYLSVAVDENDTIEILEVGVPSTDETVNVPGVFYQRGSDAYAREELASGQTGMVLDGLGVLVEFTTASTSDGTLTAYRIDEYSFNNTASGTATSGDGTTVTVNTFAQDGYYAIEANDLEGFAYRVCLNYANVDGVADPSKLVILKRDDASAPWTPLNTTQDGGAQQVCAGGLTDFSQFSIGSNEAFNVLPIELAAFDVRRDGRAVELAWQTASETENAGFEVQRAVDDGSFVVLGFEEGAGTTTTPRNYRFTDAAVPFTAELLTYRLRQIDRDGAATLSRELTVEVGQPAAFALEGSFPNPLRHAGTIRYALPVATDVRLALYDVLGREVALLVNTQQTAGRKEAPLRATTLPSGVYFLRLEAGGHVHTRQVVVVR